MSNIYLPEVPDKWLVESVQPVCGGRTFMARFADDFVMGFERMEDAHKVRWVIERRFARFGLKIHAQKTRLLRFGRPRRGGARAVDKPETFDVPSVTHYWGRSRGGASSDEKQAACGRFTRALRANQGEGGMETSPRTLKEQQCKLNEKLCGHDACHGVTGNHRMLHGLRWEEAGLWRKWFARRNRGNEPNWQRSGVMLQSFPLAPTGVIHSQM